MAAQDFDFTNDRVSDTYDRVSGWNEAPQRFVLDTDLFQDVYRARGAWRVNNVTRIPVVDQHRPEAGVNWIDARLFSDGYLRGNIKSRTGEIHCIAVDISGELAGS